MELIGMSLLLISLVLFINRPIKKEQEPIFKVDLGNGIETVSWNRLNNLTESEKEYLFKNAKQCSHLSGNLPDFNTENVVKFTDCFRS